MLTSVPRITQSLIAAVLVGLCGCGNEVRVTVPFKSNVEYPLKATVVKVPPAVVKDSKKYPDYVLSKKDGDPAATVTCLAIDYKDTNHQVGNGPYLVKLDGSQVTRLKAGAKLMLVMDGKNQKYPMAYSIE